MQPVVRTQRLQDAASAGARRDASDSPEARWQIRLLGAVEASDGVQAISRFPSRAVASLLARMALAPDRAHAREELVELLWPGVELAVGRNRLRQALSTLKSLLEPAGVPGAAVLQADRLSLRVVPGALACDVPRFEHLARAGQAKAAHALYRGEFMPGYFDEWIHDERQRLAAVHERLGPVPSGAAAAAEPLPASTAAAGVAPVPIVLPLPSYLTRLFGADMAVARVRSLVRAQRLVTLGDRHKAFARLRNRAQCWIQLGRRDEARACFELCERTAREEGDAVSQIDSLLSLSTLLTVDRQWAAALEIDRGCIALCWQRWHRHGLGYALWNPPLALARLRRPEPAMRLMGFAAAFWAASFGPLGPHDLRSVRRVSVLVRAQLGAARAQALWNEGAAMDVQQAVALALRA